MLINHRTGPIIKADVSSISPSSERIDELWVVCSFYSGVGATLLVVTRQSVYYVRQCFVQLVFPWRCETSCTKNCNSAGVTNMFMKSRRRRLPTYST